MRFTEEVRFSIATSVFGCCVLFLNILMMINMYNKGFMNGFVFYLQFVMILMIVLILCIINTKHIIKNQKENDYEDFL